MHRNANQKGKQIVRGKKGDRRDHAVDDEERVGHAHEHGRSRHGQEHRIDLDCLVAHLNGSADGVNNCGSTKDQCDA